MKYFRHRCALLGCMLFPIAQTALSAPELPVKPPTLDSQGRFWVYRNGTAQPPMPFSPYGWMSDATNVTQLIKVEPKCRDNPNTVMKPSGTPEVEQCIRVRFTWDNATWCSVAFISGPDKPAWWGETNGGRYYNLGTLAKKKLVFYARGERGGETIKGQIGVLGEKPFGDSLPEPVVSDELKLTPDWKRYEIDLKEVPAAELARICNGFGVIAERASQSGTPKETVFYVDDVYFE